MKRHAATGNNTADAAEHRVHSRFMRRCLELARKGGRAVEPNPLVGCVIARDGNTVSEGWHRVVGGPHAEADALAAAGRRARGADLYVNLEPCNHRGRTAPCTDAIIHAGVRRVFIGSLDPNPHVAGGGMLALRRAGIECNTGVLERESKALNERFIVNVTEDRPFVFLKIAQTLDGFIAPAVGESRWITGARAREEVHALRATADAVLIGAGTLRSDDPALTVRDVSGISPLRIILTDSCLLPAHARVFTDADAERTLVATRKCRGNSSALRALQHAGINVIAVEEKPGSSILPALLGNLYSSGVRTLMVEGGAAVFSAFLRARLVDRIDLFQSPKIIGSGLGTFASAEPLPLADAHSFSVDTLKRRGGDIYAVLRPSKKE